MTVMHRPVARGLRLAAAGTIAAAALAACGGSGGSAAVTPAAATSTPGATRRGFDSAEFQKIRQCLTAAGITLPTPSGFPSGRPSDRPSTRPSGSPTGPRPTGSALGRFGREFSDPTVQAALKACGITLPTRPAGGAGISPTTAPTPTD